MSKKLAIFLAILVGKHLERQSGVELPSYVYEVIEKMFKNGEFDDLQHFIDNWICTQHKPISEIEEEQKNDNNIKYNICNRTYIVYIFFIRMGISPKERKKRVRIFNKYVNNIKFNDYNGNY